MKKLNLRFLLCLLLAFFNGCFADNVGLLIVATGKYIQFVQPLIDSAREHFCTNHDVTYFVFTDGEIEGDDVVRIYQERMGWPYDTLMRWPVYNHHSNSFSEMDYLFATDADMRFEGEVGDEILSDRVGTQHPGFVGRRGTYETRRQSTAFIDGSEGSQYFAGGFNGGSRDEFLKMAATISENIHVDLEKNFIAVWHDESHVNRYFVDNPPTAILSPSYCYPENDAHYRRGIWKQVYVRRLVALDKAHAQLRTQKA